MQVSPLVSFIIKVFLWLPVCYWGWYSLAEFTTLVVINLAEPFLQYLFPRLISGIEQMGYTMEVIANATVAAQNIPKGMVAELPIPVNPLIYSYGLPMTLALILASPFNFVRTLRNIFVSILLFLLIQIWGVSFETSKVLFLQIPPELIGNRTLHPWQLDIVALGYQFGALILPAITPIIVWILLYRDFIVRFVPSLHSK